MHGSLLLSFLLSLSVQWVSSTGHILSSMNAPSTEYFDNITGASIKLWLKPSKTLLIHSGKIRHKLSSSAFVLGVTGSTEANVYVGHSITIGSETRTIVGYTGDANSDGDVLDAGDAQVFVDKPFGRLGIVSEIGDGSPYQIFAGNVIHAAKEYSTGTELWHWTSSAKAVVEHGIVAAESHDSNVVVLSAPVHSVIGSLIGLGLAVGDEIRTIVKFEESTRIAIVSPAFTFSPRKGAEYKILRIFSASVESTVLDAGGVQSVSATQPYSKFQLRIGTPLAQPGDYVGLDVAVITNSTTEVRSILAHTKDGFVIVSPLKQMPTPSSDYVVWNRRPTVTTNVKTFLNGYNFVRFDGKSSFLTLDEMVSSRAGESGDLLSKNVVDNSSFTILSVVRPGNPVVIESQVSSSLAFYGQVESEDAFNPFLKLRLESSASEQDDAYTGLVVLVSFGDGSEETRTVQQYLGGTRELTLNQSLSRRASLLAPILISSHEPSRVSFTLDAGASSARGRYCGMYARIGDERRLITHHGAEAHSSGLDGRVLTVKTPFSSPPLPGQRVAIESSQSLLSFSGSESGNEHVTIDFGQEHGVSPSGDVRGDMVYYGAVRHHRVETVRVDAPGRGYVSGGAWVAAPGGARGTIRCDEEGRVVAADVTHSGERTRAAPAVDPAGGGILYPPGCNGKTVDVSGCASKPQEDSITELRIVAGGTHYVAGEVRVSGGGGAGFAATFAADSAGAVYDYAISDASAHGAGYSRGDLEVVLYYAGTDIPMTGSVTAVHPAVELGGGGGGGGGVGRDAVAPLVVVCEPPCVGGGLRGICHVDAAGRVSEVEVTAHGGGYNPDQPPRAWCGAPASAPEPAAEASRGLVVEIAHGASLVAVRAGGAALTPLREFGSTSARGGAYVSGVRVGPGATAGCTAAHTFSAVGGGGVGFRGTVGVVSPGGGIKALTVTDPGVGYTAPPQLVASHAACRCDPDGIGYISAVRVAARPAVLPAAGGGGGPRAGGGGRGWGTLARKTASRADDELVVECGGECAAHEVVRLAGTCIYDPVTLRFVRVHITNPGQGYVAQHPPAVRCRWSGDGPELVAHVERGAHGALDGTVPGNMDACLTASVSTTDGSPGGAADGGGGAGGGAGEVGTAASGWQIQVLIVDGPRVYSFVNGLRLPNRALAFDLYPLAGGAGGGVDWRQATIGAHRAGAAVSRFWSGDVAEVLAYGCNGDPTGRLLGCTAPADLDRLGSYLARKYGLEWRAATGPQPPADPRERVEAVVHGAAGTGAVPAITAVWPSVALGAQYITIAGANFGRPGEDEPAVKVTLGELPCSHLTIVDGGAGSGGESRLRCMAPAGGGSAARVDVRVAVWGVVATAAGAYSFSAPRADSVSPTEVRSAGGDSITVTGLHFAAGVPYRVTIEAHNITACTAVTVVSDRQLICRLPPLRTDVARLVFTADGQAGGAGGVVDSRIAFSVKGVPRFYVECRPRPAGAPPPEDCMGCCAPRCQHWELSPEGNNRARGGGYYSHCQRECGALCGVAVA